MSKIFKIALPIILLIVIIIQFFRGPIPKVEKVPSMDVHDVVEISNPVSNILRAACYDCHSAETNYPFYSKIVPIAWWIYEHVEEGSEELNFSVWGTYPDEKKLKKLEELIDEVEKGNMPLDSYMNTHSDASLSDEQISELVIWAKSYMSTIEAGE